MASVGSNEIPISATFFEIPISTDEPKSAISGNDTPREEPKGGLSFSVGLDDNQANSDLQLAAEALRIKSEKRRSNQATQRAPESPDVLPEDIPMTTDELIGNSPSTPSETGTYTLRLDSAEVRERRTAHGLTDMPSGDQNSATESTEEYDVPKEVNQRITEWFSRNEAAQSRQSEANESNLEDIRQKAKDRIKEKNNPPGKPEQSKIVLTREDRKSKAAPTSGSNIRNKGSNPQVRLTRAMLLRKNRALGIKNPESSEGISDEKLEEKKSPTSGTTVTNRKVSARLENLSKPKNRGEEKTNRKSKPEVQRQRSFSHEDAKVYRGRPVAKTENRRKEVKETKPSSRSTSLNRGGSGLISVSAKPARPRRGDQLSQSVRAEPNRASRVSATSRNIPVAKRSNSLTRTGTGSTLKSKPERINRTNSVKNQSKNSLNQSWAGGFSSSNLVSSSSSSRPSRPQTATSQREISHEKSILYSVFILSNNCLQKTFEILNDLGGDPSDFEKEFLSRQSPGSGEISPHDVENVLSNLCSLDKCLSKIRSQQKQNSEVTPEVTPTGNDMTGNDDNIPAETYTVDSLNTVPSLVETQDEIVINHQTQSERD